MSTDDLPDYYTLLGIDSAASVDRVRKAFHLFARKYHPDNFSLSGQPKQERAEEIYRRGTEAYRVLLDPVKRASYDKGLEQGHTRYSAEHADHEKKGKPRGGQVVVNSPRARTFYATARRAIAAKDWNQAKLNLKLALQHDSENVGLKAELAKVQEEMKKK